MNRKAAILALSGALLQGAVICALAATSDTVPANHPKFDSDIVPVFNKYCVGCHAGAQPKGDIMLSFKDENDARSRMATNDEFWDKVSTMVKGDLMPPASVKNRPTEGERKLLTDWIANDVLTIGGKPDPGPLVVHRLNNREYANTIRDLLYLPASYNAAADFPADERGDGFDNNSDTLTISPVLIEHYLDAAAKSVTEAFKPRVKDVKDTNVGGSNPLNAPSKAVKGADFANSMGKVRINIEAFLPRAWRRPVTKEDVDGIMKFAALSFSHDGEIPGQGHRAGDPCIADVAELPLPSGAGFPCRRQRQGLSAQRVSARFTAFLFPLVDDAGR